MKKIIISSALIFGGFVFASAQNAVSTDTKEVKEVKACCSKGSTEKGCCSKGSTGATSAKTCSSSEVKACSGHGHAATNQEAQPAVTPNDKKSKKKDVK
ncbi:MAG: hypothetical protein N2167_08580 [Flavobacteriales bacterium]|nr:hypothetical protein [Flavobacteriales bacterium]